MAAPGRWWWRRSPLEAPFEEHRISYQITLATRAPLNPDHLVQTMRHLFRKVPSLRACFKQRDGQLWTREMDEEMIDFEVIIDTSAEEINKNLLSHNYNTATGPLWCVRLCPEPSCPDAGEAGGAMPGYPHVSTIFLGIHHGITDGMSNMLICGWLVRLLDQVIAATHIDDLQQLGTFVSAERTEKLVDDWVHAIARDPELKQKLVAEAQINQRLISQVNVTYEAMGQEEGETLRLIKELDNATTASFIKKCHAEGVTVNSSLIALCNLGVMDVLVDGGLTKDSYHVRCITAINARRYWDTDKTRSLGVHALPLFIGIDTPAHAKDHFWDYARSVHQQLQNKYKSGDTLQDLAVTKFLDPKSSTPKYPLFEFGLSNMGDVSDTVGVQGEHVAVTRVLRTVALHTMPYNWNVMVHSFHGRLMLVLGYSTRSITPHLAKIFCNRIITYLQENI